MNDEQMREWQKDDQKPKINRPTRRMWIDRCIEEWKTGNELAWVNLRKGCGLNEEGSSYHMSGELIAEWEGWTSLSEIEQADVLACARSFLVLRDDPHRFSDTWQSTNWSTAAAHAVSLLMEHLRDDAELSLAVAKKWAATWFEEFLNVSDGTKQIAARLYPLNPKECLDVLRENFVAENASDQSCRTLPVLTECWNEALSIELVGWLKDEGIRPVTFRTAFEFLAFQSPSHANSLAGFWLDQLQINPASIPPALQDSIIFCSLIFTGGTLFEQAFSLLGDAQNARRILCMGHSTFGIHGHGLSSKLNSLTMEQLGRFTVLMIKAFPERDDGEEEPSDAIEPEGLSGEELEAQCRLESRDITAGMTASRASSGVMIKFCEVASQEEFEAVSRQIAEPRRTELAFIRSRVLKQLAQADWGRVPPDHVLKLVQQPHACFIRSNDDLLEFVLRRLRDYSKQDWDIAVQPLWNEKGGKPDGLKHEDVLSNCLKRWLDGSRSLVVNREVQLIEIMPHRLDLKIDIPGEAPLCTIVEVKKDENIEAPTSMEKQLLDDYLVNGGQTHGIYLLAWFGNSASRIGGASPEEDLAFLQNQQNALSLHHGMRVEVMVMDCRHRAAKFYSVRKSPVSKTVKKKQITPAKKASRKRAQP